VNGAWGLISVGLFATPRFLNLAYGNSEHPGFVYVLRDGTADGTLLAAQLVGLLMIMGWVFVVMFPFFVWLDWKGWFRADPLEEIVGLDTSYHGGLALLSSSTEERGINAEYVSAYRQKKEDTLRRRNTSRNAISDTVVDVSVGGHDDRGATGGEF